MNQIHVLRGGLEVSIESSLVVSADIVEGVKQTMDDIARMLSSSTGISETQRDMELYRLVVSGR